MPPSDFRVELDLFRGPLDLLLYLVREHELDVVEIPIGRITDQYLEFLEVIRQIDVNAAGEFLAMASLLVEMKSRLVLPRAEEVEDEVEDPRQDLVRTLLEYKEYRDAASVLEERARDWQERFPRTANDLPPRRRELADEPIHEIELWDLVSALGRILKEHANVKPPSIVYDETPIEVYMSRIHAKLKGQGRIAFGHMFKPGMHKSSLVSIFLAIMELIRHHGAKAEQDQLFSEIWISPGEAEELDLNNIDNYDTKPEAESEQPGEDAKPAGDAPSEPSAETDDA